MPAMGFYRKMNIGPYRTISFLGSGASAEVHLAKHKRTGELVAIKLLHAYVIQQKAQERESFLKEAKLLERLQHPGIIRIWDAGFDKTRPYFVMDYAPQGSLREKHPEGTILPLSTVSLYVQQIASALEYAHSEHIVHCDIKPDNILLTQDSRLLLGDFGISQVIHTTLPRTTRGPGGTAEYMAPEQFLGKPEAASDQYALGIMAYEWLCGTPPFRGGEFLFLMDQHRKNAVPSLHSRNLNIPEAVEQVILKALMKDPRERYPNVKAFAQAFKRVVPDPGPVSRPTLAPQRRSIPVQRLADERRQPGQLGGTKARLFSPLSRILFPQPKEPGPPISIPAESASDKRQLFTALDIGTAFAKAIIVEVVDDQANVLGVGYHPQSYAHMSDGIVTDIAGVIANCNEALLKAEQTAGGVVAPNTVIGIAGELVKGSSTTVSRQRQQPARPITAEELDTLITSAQQHLLKSARERIVAETGYSTIDIRLINSVAISVRIDGQTVTNPVGFRGRLFSLTLFSAFAPLTQLGALETVAQGLDLILTTIVAEPYALARCLSTNASPDSGAIFIDVGGGTTDIALVRQGGIEETRMFAMGGRTFTRRIATSNGISIKEAETRKISYSNNEISSKNKEEIRAILAPECQTWMDSVELLIEELAKGELLPPAIYIVGGGSALPDLHERLENFPWRERLPFSRQPIIRTVQPEMVTSIVDRNNLLKTAQDITPMALAYQAVELNNSNNILERALDRVITMMHI